MIKFFRRIRKRLLSEGKFSKYIFYALGEILLVVIGILIALSINNWNENQKERRIEAQYLHNIVRDLNGQLNSIDTQMRKEQSYYEAASYLIEDYNKDQAFTLDSFFYTTASYLGSRKTFVITDPTFTDLISSGKISVLKNQTRKDQLLSYYHELERIEKVIQNNNSIIIDQHFNQTLLKICYNFDNPSELRRINHSNFPGHVVLPKYEPGIQELSKNVISKAENKLELMNAITSRQSVALGHYELLIKIKSDTKSLIEELKNE